MLATDLEDLLLDMGARVRALPRETMDITDPASVERHLSGADVLVNCAAYTAVDQAEEDEATAHLINATGPQVLAQAATVAGVRLVHISTDYVFAGDARVPYKETDHVAPQGAYGRTKAAGERAVIDAGGNPLIVRTAWLYGEHGACFPKTIARLARERGAVSVVSDQIGQPTWTRDLSQFIVDLVAADAPSGIYHGTSQGQASWFDFAREVVTSAGLGDVVSPVTTADFPRPAPRPAWSVLGHEASEALGVPTIGDWRERWHAAAPAVLGLELHPDEE